jgi:hypothetical protein
MLLQGCAYKSNVDYGVKFTSKQVSQIKKKITTKSELLQIFGEPNFKSVISESSEKWIYSYTGGSATSQAFTMKTTSDIKTQMLDILIENNIVINFSETNSTHNMNISIQ